MIWPSLNQMLFICVYNAYSYHNSTVLKLRLAIICELSSVNHIQLIEVTSDKLVRP